MKGYRRGVWEALNYMCKLSQTYDSEKALEIIEKLRNDLEENVAVDFRAKIEGLENF